MGAKKKLVPLLLCLALLTTTPPNSAKGLLLTDCPSNTNYTRGGAFQSNLDVLLSSLPAAAAASSGFAEKATGASPDQAFGLAQCRADVNASECRACLDQAAGRMASDGGGKCSSQKKAVLIYDRCLMRHSNSSFFGAADTSVALLQRNAWNATQPEKFMPLLGTLMNSLRWKAAYESPRMFAVSSAAVTPFVNIYGMAQCTRDLAADDCNRCLTKAVGGIPRYCDTKQGCLVMFPSCSVQFEVSPFYNVQAAEAAMSPAPGGGSVDGSDHASTRSNVRTALIVVSILAAVTMLLLLTVTAYIFKNRKPHEGEQIASNGLEDDEEMRFSEPLTYDLSTLRAATDNFSEENKLGQGGFGPVYRGTLRNGEAIAVKRLSRTSHQGHIEMKNEVVLVAKLQHKNLVRLLGCCIEEDEKLLVYEFLINKSLDKILSGTARQQELSWGQRYNIIEGIARGLLYLHEDSRLTIIHRDLKPGNILLDADMNPKISDFGLAKLFDINWSVANTTRIAGTYGYMAPEYAVRGTFSTKSDVYSYGVLVLEIVTGRRPSENLIKSVWEHWCRGSVPQLLEGCPADGTGPQEKLRCIHVGLLCIQNDPHLRPGMASVVVMLNSRSVTLPVPTFPAFVNPSEGPWAAAPEPSTNEGSVSDLEPR